MINKPEADEKVQAGWIRAWLAFEVLAVNKDVANNSLNKLLEKIETEGKAVVYDKKMTEPVEVKNPTKKIESAFSVTSEINLISKNLDDLLFVVMRYGPSAIEILEPKELKLKIGEAQNILNTISQMMHKFAAAGVGGLVFVNEKV